MPASPPSPKNFLQGRYEIATPEDFGAVGDGATDDLTAVQAAVNYVQGNGGKVFLPKTYAVSNKVTITGSCIFEGHNGVPPMPDEALGGTGWGGWLASSDTGANSGFRSTSATADILSFEPSSPNLRPGGVKNLSLYATTQKTAGAGIRTNQYAWPMVIEGVGTSRLYDSLYLTAASNGAWKIWIDRCQILDSKHYGIAIGNPTFGGEVYINNTEIINYPGSASYATGSNVGLYLSGCSGNWFSNLSVLGFNTGVYMTGLCEYQYFNNVLADLCDTGWAVVYGGSRIRDIYLDNCYATSNSYGSSNVGGFLLSGAMNDIFLSRCTVGRYQESGCYGFKLAAGVTNAQLNGCVTYDLDLTGTHQPYTALDLSAGTSGLQINGGRFEAANKSVAFGTSGHTNLQIVGARFPNGYSGTYPTSSARIAACLPSTGGAGVAFTDL